MTEERNEYSFGSLKEDIKYYTEKDLGKTLFPKLNDMWDSYDAQKNMFIDFPQKNNYTYLMPNHCVLTIIAVGGYLWEFKLMDIGFNILLQGKLKDTDDTPREIRNVIYAALKDKVKVIAPNYSSDDEDEAIISKDKMTELVMASLINSVTEDSQMDHLKNLIKWLDNIQK